MKTPKIILLVLWCVAAAASCGLPLHSPAAVTGSDPLPAQYVGLADANGQGVTFTSGNVPVSGTITANLGTADPCEAPNVVKSSAVINITTATTTELVAAVASKVVFVCGFSATAAGTTPTLQFETGTKVTTPCDTGPAVLTGAYTPGTSSEFLVHNGPGTIFAGAASGELCAVTTGTPTFKGVLNYVQQ